MPSLEEFTAILDVAQAQIGAVIASLDPAAIGRIAGRELPFILLVGLLSALLVRRRRRASRKESLELGSLTAAPRALGYASSLIFFGGFGMWAATAMLASAVVAPGVVSPDGYRKTVQHLEGGIVRKIHVREGDVVSAGQLLVSLQAVDAQGRYDELRERYAHFLAVEARLSADLSGSSDIEFSPQVIFFGQEGAQRIIAGQRELLKSRRATRHGRELILGKRVRQIEEEITGLRQVIEAQSTQLALIDREIEGTRKLYDAGLERLPRLLALERAQADIKANQASSRAQVARSEQQIGETEMQILSMRQQDNETLNDEITKTSAVLAELRSQLPSREDVLTRTSIMAPIAGTVMNMRVTTESGVLGSGEPLLDIVPSEPNLIIDAHVKPVDIENVRTDMKTRVLLTAYSQRYLPQILGSLRSISADRLVDERTGEGYFLAKIVVDSAEFAKLRDVRLSPGMPADVMILTGEHTLLDYFIAPLRDSLTRSFREN